MGCVLRDFKSFKATAVKMTLMGRDSVPFLPKQTTELRYVPRESILRVFFYFDVQRKVAYNIRFCNYSM